MPDTKASALPTITVTADDYSYIVDAPGSSPGSGKALISDMVTAFASIGSYLTEASGDPITAKATPVAADKVLMLNSAASDAPVTATWTQTISALGLLTDTSGTAFSTKASPTTSDLAFQFDAAAGEAPVTSTWQQVVDGLTLVRSNITGITGADRVTNIVTLTQAEYDAIGAPSASTIYFIVG